MKLHQTFAEHRAETKRLAKALKWTDVFDWLVSEGYFPESYVMPPCFTVAERPAKRRLFYPIKSKRFSKSLKPKELGLIHFPKTGLTDREFGIIHPAIHNDIAYHIGRNWKRIVEALVPDDSDVACYSFPVPIHSRHPGRLGRLRSGRMIYEFLALTEDDLARVAYRYNFIVKADIRAFYPSIYTHSIAWVLDTKKKIRRGQNRWDYSLLGNRLDRLFQYANDQKTNGIPIGPAVSDVVAELVAAAIDRELTQLVRSKAIDCQMTRFKDDYRILARTQEDANQIIKMLQASASIFDLQLADEKCHVTRLPEGLFRPWVSEYHAVNGRKGTHLSWKEFRELYLAVLRIDSDHPGTGVIDRFLADILLEDGMLAVRVNDRNLERVISMLLMLGHRRIKAFPKILGIVESLLRSNFGRQHEDQIIDYLDEYLHGLSQDESRNLYLISWIAYFINSNSLKGRLTKPPKLQEQIPSSVFNNRPKLFKDCSDYTLFRGCRAAAKKFSILDHVDIFNPPHEP